MRNAMAKRGKTKNRNGIDLCDCEAVEPEEPTEPPKEEETEASDGMD